jgi:hypothetical protein
MAKLSALPELAIISGYKGTIDFYLWRGLPCARAWPVPPSAPRSAAVQAQWPVFAAAAHIWPTLDPEVQAAYVTMATGATLSGRDLSLKMYMNADSIYHQAATYDLR